MILETDGRREGKLNLFSSSPHSALRQSLALLCTIPRRHWIDTGMNILAATRHSGTSAHWHQATFALAYGQKHWLMLQGSLTQALKAMGDFSLRVLFEGIEQVWQDEAEALRLHPGKEAWVREVVMALDGIPCVAARSLTPLKASRGDWRGLRHCGNTPLGSQLYHRADIRRTPFQWRAWHLFLQEQGKTSWHARVIKLAEESIQYHHDTTSSQSTLDEKLPWGNTLLLDRRSVFYKSHHRYRKEPTRQTGANRPLNGTPMIVMECFLPAFWPFTQGYQRLNLNPRWSPCRRARA